jgi:hypothetical protein
MLKNESVVAVFGLSTEVNAALHRLTATGWELGNISIVGKLNQPDELAIGFYTRRENLVFWGQRGAFWTAIWNQFGGGVSLSAPPPGNIVVFGRLSAIVIAAVEGAILAGGLSALSASMSSAGIPRESSVQYEQAVKAGGFLVIVHGTAQEIMRTTALLASSGPTTLDFHDGKTSHFLVPAQAEEQHLAAAS